MGIPVALQLYSVRDQTAKDFTGTLAKVAAIGYQGVEFAGYGDLSANQLRAELDKLHLEPAGSHVGWEALKKDLAAAIAFNAEIGNPYIVCPHAPIQDEESVRKFAALFNAWGRKIQENGMEFCYHNHSHEFAKVGGEYVLDLLYRETDPAFVEIEFDTCWIHAGGADPVKYIRKYAGRCPLIHLKDMKAGGDKVLTELGSGVVNVAGIVKESEAVGVEWLIVEQDRGERPTLESARISYEFLKRNKLL
jgi:sugar phosphate isomerase/epimerase